MRGHLKLSASLLARQTPAVRALLAKAQARGALVTHEVVREVDVLTITITGLKMPSLANISDWKVANRAKQAQSAALKPILDGLARPPLPWDVVITRVAPKALDTATNLDACAKRVVDLIARWVGVDDATDEVVRYTVRQETGPVACRVRIGPRGVSDA